MRIVCVGGEWVVLAEWHGAERVVCRGSLGECLAFAPAGERVAVTL